MIHKIKNTQRIQVMQVTELQYNRLLKHLKRIEFLYDELEDDGEKILIINDLNLWFFIKSIILDNEF